MRELRFRVWGLYGDEYTYIDKENRAEAESFWDRGCIAILDEKHIIECGTDEDGEGEGCEYWYVEAVKAIEQYTGLKDKNGKEIYEGDIVKLTGKVAQNKSTIYKVVWDSLLTGYDLISLEPGKSDVGYLNETEIENRYEVIGNIHENPELLGHKG